LEFRGGYLSSVRSCQFLPIPWVVFYSPDMAYTVSFPKHTDNVGYMKLHSSFDTAADTEDVVETRS